MRQEPLFIGFAVPLTPIGTAVESDPGVLPPVSKVEQGSTLIPVVIRNDGVAVPVIPKDAQPPFDIVILSQNQYLRALLDGGTPTPYDVYLGKSNIDSSPKLASRLASQIASMPDPPANVQNDRVLRTEGAKTFKAAKLFTDFQQANQLLDNLNKSPDQIIQGLVLDLFG